MSFRIIKETEETAVSLKETENVSEILKKAEQQGIGSLVFKGDCDRDTLRSFLSCIYRDLTNREINISLVHDRSFCGLFEDLEEYLCQQRDSQPVTFCNRSLRAVPCRSQWEKELDEVVNSNREMSFQQKLYSLIDERKMTEVEVYKRADLDRKLFSKIRSHQDYRPSKKTVLALAMALKLDLEETEDLLARAEYALSPASKTDLIVEYFISHENYNLYELKTALYEYGLIE